jgi:hypothetical protein
VLIGPPGSAKTSFVHAVPQACYLPSRDSLRLEFIPEAGIAEEHPRALSILTGGEAREASRSISECIFELRAYPRRRRWSKAPPQTTRFSLTDGPGGAFFASSREAGAESTGFWRRRMEHAMVGATSLVLFVNAAKPDVTLIQRAFPSVIEKLRTEVGVPPPRPPTWRRWLSRLPLLRSSRLLDTATRQRTFERRLDLKRVLILLTRIDVLAADAVETLRRGVSLGESRARHLAPGSWTPQQLAEAIDPVAQARSLLGPILLNLVRDAIPPQATLAVGVCSAGGFEPSAQGMPLLGRGGQPLRQFAGESEDDLVRRWRPFGVREALLFVTQGRAGGTVREVTPRDLGIDDQSEESFALV